MNKTELDELAKKHEAASTRPWAAYCYEGQRDAESSHRYSVCAGDALPLPHDDISHECIAMVYADTEADVAALAEQIAALHNAFPSLLALARFGLKAKAFLEEHGVHTSAGLGLMRVNALTLEDVKRRAAIIDQFQALLESARALTEAKGGK